MDANDKKLMLLDGLSLINRAYYALPAFSTKDGIPTGAILGFLNIYFKLIEEERPVYGAVAFDLPAPTFRHKQYTEYKATRKPFPEELVAQIPILKELLATMNIPTVQMEGYEADDIMGMLARQAEAEGYHTTIVSGDRDLLQLATSAVKIRIPKTSRGQTTTEDYYAADVAEKIGVTPTEYIDVKALMGDASDNIPGVPQIGEKTAVKIIQQYGNIEAAIADVDNVMPKRASDSLRQHADLARLSKELATIITTEDAGVGIDELRLGETINEASLEEFRRLELRSLLKKYSKARKKDREPGTGSHNVGRIVSAAEFAEFTAKTPAGQACAYHFALEGGTPVGLAVACSGESVFLPLDADSMGCIGAFFQGDVIKIGFDAKKDAHLLAKQGIAIKNLAFDLLLAGYLLNNVKDGDGLNDVSLEYLKESIYMPTAAEAQISLLYVEVDTLQETADAALARADVIARVYPIMAEMLKEQQLDGLFYEIEMPLLAVLTNMEQLGIKVDGKFIAEYGDMLDGHINRLTTEIYALAGSEFNINSTKQLAKVLFEDLGIPSVKKTKTGYSTNMEVLEKLAANHEIAHKILEYRSYTKLRSTYVDGLAAAIGPDGRIHTTFNQALTSTGRLSSNDPNLQNIPVRTELGRELRRAFVPRDGYVFVDADYSQIELRILAHLSQDETFLTAFRENQDIHRITAAQVFHVGFDEVTDQMRRMAKAVNFGIVYGISAFSLAEDIKVSVREADGFIEGYFAKYPTVKHYLDWTVATAKEVGYAQTIFNRRRNLPELAHSAFVTRSFGERAAMNMPVQGSAADIIKIAMVKVHGRLKREGLESKLILQVHDELLIEAKEAEVEQVRAILRDEMENAVQLSVPLAIDINVGKSWYDAK
ncbi:MAG: DNA polymerase I [Defluviitaleaceae bacterium]|nr:DNA polymerase I [Defluviitaleaceae bacterium]